VAEQDNKTMAELVVLADYGDRLRGVVYGHPDFHDGEKVVTSEIVIRKAGVVETKNTIYRLTKKD
jgi:hypothetical protein